MRRLLLLAPLAAVACSGPAAERREAADGGDPQRLVALLDYVAGDYPLAVDPEGRVLDPGEYDEQVRFASDMRSIAQGLLRDASDTDSLLARLAALEELVKKRKPPADIAGACRAAGEEAVVLFQIPTMPRERPDLERAQALYVQACTECHGPTGDGDTPRAKTLDPQPFRFREPGRLGDLSPYRVYNALTFGVPGTAMASFDALSPEDRWNLAFYVFHLGHEGRPAEGPVAMTLADLASRSDSQVLAALREEGYHDPEQGLVYARREAAFAEAPTGVGVDRTRSMLRRAVAAHAGRPRPRRGSPRHRRLPPGLRAPGAPPAGQGSRGHARRGGGLPRPARRPVAR